MAAPASDGELKSKTVDSATVGGVAVAKSESTGPVANSTNSRKSGRQNTTATASAKREQSLQIMRDCVEMVREDGVATQITAFDSKSGKRCTIIVLENVDLVDDDLVWIG